MYHTVIYRGTNRLIEKSRSCTIVNRVFWFVNDSVTSSCTIILRIQTWFLDGKRKLLLIKETIINYLFAVPFLYYISNLYCCNCWYNFECIFVIAPWGTLIGIKNIVLYCIVLYIFDGVYSKTFVDINLAWNVVRKSKKHCIKMSQEL
jgi:hypothetical protein